MMISKLYNSYRADVHSKINKIFWNDSEQLYHLYHDIYYTSWSSYYKRYTILEILLDRLNRITKR